MLGLSLAIKGWGNKNFLGGNSFINHSIRKENHPFKYLYVKICTIGYYTGFYSSLKDPNWANGGNLEFSSKNEEQW